VCVALATFSQYSLRRDDTERISPMRRVTSIDSIGVVPRVRRERWPRRGPGGRQQPRTAKELARDSPRFVVGSDRHAKSRGRFHHVIDGELHKG